MQSISEKNNYNLEYIRILHLSDFHYPNIKFEEETLINKENGLHSPHISILDEVYEVIDDVDFILISGDFTSNAKLEAFEDCLSFVCRKFSNHKALIYAVLGNHDLCRGYGKQKFDAFLKKAQKYPQLTFCQDEVCEKKRITNPKSMKPELDLVLINTCKHSSDNPIIPDKLKECVEEPLRHYLNSNDISQEKQFDQDLEKEVQYVWKMIKSKIEESTLIDGIFFDSDDYDVINDSISPLGSFICVSHYNLVSFSGIDKLNSFFSDQGKFRNILVNHDDTIIYLNGHTHTHECTVIESPNDQTNKLICITAPPLFKLKTSELNGFNIIDVVLKKNSDENYKPIGCKIKQINNLKNENPTKMKRIRFSKNVNDIKFSTREFQIIKALKHVTKKSGSARLKQIINFVNADMDESKQFKIDEIHDVLMYFWWIGVLDEYSAMIREDEFEAELLDYVGGVLCAPLSR